MLAVAVMICWGTTFASTKLLLLNGLAPQDIFLYRFALAYAGIWFFGKQRLFAATWRDEGKLALLGILGGSLYFQTENMALQYTQASNVALVLSVAPLLTSIIAHFFARGERLTRRILIGLVVAFLGVALVVFNGSVILKMHPLGDALCFAAALSWAFYTLILKDLGMRYSSLFITRKVFFYGLLTILPIFIFQPLNSDWAILARPIVWGNLLYLGVAASLLCFLFWNRVVEHLGAIRATNYLYIGPPITLITAAIVLHEIITPMALVGAGLILFGLVQAGRR